MGDNLPFVNYAAPSAAPTAAPSAAPSVPTTAPTNNPTEPTLDPTLDPTTPTASPSVAPTMPTFDPTAFPSSDPTASPTHFCDTLLEEFADFVTISAEYVETNASIQILLANITHRAIAESALDYGIHYDYFSIDFVHAFGALSIQYDVCSDDDGTLYTLSIVLENEEEAISSTITKEVSALFGVDGDSMTVSVSMIELSVYIGFEHVIVSMLLSQSPNVFFFQFNE